MRRDIFIYGAGGVGPIPTVGIPFPRWEWDLRVFGDALIICRLTAAGGAAAGPPKSGTQASFDFIAFEF